MNGSSGVIDVPGLGPLQSYHNYYDRFFSHGVIYYLRDSYFKELESKLDSGATSKDVRALVSRIQALQKRIQEFEAHPHLFLTGNGTEYHDHPTISLLNVVPNAAGRRAELG